MPTFKTTFMNKNNSIMKTLRINKLILYISAIVVLAFSMSSCGNNTSSTKNQSNKQEQTYETVPTAFENGHIKWGMTYQEVAKVLGQTHQIDEYDGIVTGAYYDHQRYGLYFDEYGKLESISRDGYAYKSNDHPDW